MDVSILVMTGQRPGRSLPVLAELLDVPSARGEVIPVRVRDGEEKAARPYGTALAEALKRARGRWILSLGEDPREGAVAARALYAARDVGDVLIGVPAGGAAPPTLGERLLKNALALPTAHGLRETRLYRREVAQELNLRLPGRESLLEALVQAQNAGWQICDIVLPPGAGATGRDRVRWLSVGSLLTLWWTRNSAMGADYDERAFNSRIPLQRYWQRKRHEIILDFSGRRGRILDIGCGSSRIIQAIPHAIGLDILLKKLRYLRRKGHPLAQGSAWGLPFRDGVFDEVICSEVIEHIPAWSHLFREFARVTRPGGILIVGTPDYSRHVWVGLEIAYGIVLPHAYAHEHITHYTHASMREHVRQAGFRVQKCRYVGGGEMIFLARKTGQPCGGPE